MHFKDEANLAAGFYGALAMGSRPTLLIVDFQKGFTEPGLTPLASDCSSAIVATNRLIRAIRDRGNVIYTVIAYGPGAPEAGIWQIKCPTIVALQRGSPAVELDPRLNYDPQHDLILQKSQASAFFGTPLAGLLAARSCDSLFLAGCTTSGCVRASAVDALQYGFPPFVVSDCVADRSQTQHMSNISDLESKYAEVVGLADAEGLLAGPRAA